MYRRKKIIGNQFSINKRLKRCMTGNYVEISYLISIWDDRTILA